MFFALQLITSNTLPTTPEVNEESNAKSNAMSATVNSKDTSPRKEEGKTRPLSVRLHCCCCCRLRSRKNRSDGSDRESREYFYRKNPSYERENRTEIHSLNRRFLFRPLVVHSFDDPMPSPCNTRPYNLAGRSAYVVCGVRAARLERAKHSKQRANSSFRKRRNLYQYPNVYYNAILRNLEAEAKTRV